MTLYYYYFLIPNTFLLKVGRKNHLNITFYSPLHETVTLCAYFNGMYPRLAWMNLSFVKIGSWFMGFFINSRSFLFNLKRLHGKEPTTHQHKNKYVIVKSNSTLLTLYVFLQRFLLHVFKFLVFIWFTFKKKKMVFL